MSPSGQSPRRLVMTVVACAALLIVAASTALGQTGSSHEPSEPAAEGPTEAGASSVTNSGTASYASGFGPVSASTTTAEGSSFASPAWCCATGSVPGLTVMGQATIKGQGSAARDAAIAEAVADATDQAQAAADAAGIHLGAVLDIQVSAMAVVYPIEGTVIPNSGIAVGSTERPGAGTEPGATGAGAIPDRYLGSATVTITWAIG
jgi:Protein of unknown function (DUF541)